MSTPHGFARSSEVILLPTKSINWHLGSFKNSLAFYSCAWHFFAVYRSRNFPITRSKLVRVSGASKCQHNEQCSFCENLRLTRSNTSSYDAQGWSPEWKCLKIAWPSKGFLIHSNFMIRSHGSISYILVFLRYEYASFSCGLNDCGLDLNSI